MSEPSLACVECGYDLRGLAADGNCPECGAPVEATTHRSYLSYLDPLRVGRLAQAMEAATFSSAMILTAMVVDYLSWQLSSTTALYRPAMWLNDSAAMAWWWSAWLLATPLRRGLDEWIFERRTLLRLIVIASVALRVLPLYPLLPAAALTLIGITLGIFGSAVYYMLLQRIGTWCSDRTLEVHAPFLFLSSLACTLLTIGPQIGQSLGIRSFSEPRVWLGLLGALATIGQSLYAIVVMWHGRKQLWRSAEQALERVSETGIGSIR